MVMKIGYAQLKGTKVICYIPRAKVYMFNKMAVLDYISFHYVIN